MSNVPKLRFKEFSGEWEENAINEVCDYVDYRGKTPPKVKKGIFLVTAKNIKKGYINYEISKEYVQEDEYRKIMSRGMPQIGDVLITTEAPCGNVAQVNNENIALAQRVIKYRGKKNILDNNYLKCELLSEKFQKNLYKISTGGTVKGVKGSTLHKTKIRYPKDIKEQEKIGSFFSIVDKKIEKQQEKVNLLEEYKKGMMQKIFSQEIRFKDENGEEYPEWEEKKLGELDIKLTRGPFGSALKKEFMVSKSSNTYKVYEQKHAIKKNATIGNYYIDEKRYIQLRRFEVEPGDFIMSCSGTIGEIFKIPKDAEKGIINQALLKIRVGMNLNHQYFIYSFKKNLDSLETKGSGIKNITSIKFLKDEFVLNIPIISEQKKIADFLSKIDDKLNKEKEKLDFLKEWKKGLLQKMFV